MLDTEGKELAATGDGGEELCGSSACICGIPGRQSGDSGMISFLRSLMSSSLEYVLVANGDSEDVYMLGKIAAFQIQSLLVAYKERFDKDNFIKNLLLDNLLACGYL